MNLRAVLSVGFILFGMALWVLSEWTAFIGGTEIKLRIAGRGPRDSLSGRYLTYRVDYGGGNLPDGRGRYCICLKSGLDGISYAHTTAACPEIFASPQNCTAVLKGHSGWRGDFVAGIERFYIPERYSEVFRQAPPNAVIKLNVTRNGVGYVKDLLIDGEPYYTYAERKLAER